MLFGARKAGCFKEVAALHSDHLRQVPLYIHHLGILFNAIAPIDEPLMASLLMHVSSHVCCLPFTIGNTKEIVGKV